jgi:hypothetical protein
LGAAFVCAIFRAVYLCKRLHEMLIRQTFAHLSCALLLYV